MVSKALILVYYKENVKTIMETNSFDYIKNRVFSQLSNNKLLHLIVFFFKNPNLTKSNYKIYDKELLAIIKCFEK